MDSIAQTNPMNSIDVKRNYLHLLWRPLTLVVWILSMTALFFIIRALGLGWYKEIPHYFHRGCQSIFGLRIVRSGIESLFRPTLFISNHISYLDIFVLGDIRAYFIAKSEVAHWPVLGPLARFQNTLFIERKAGQARQQLKVMKDHLRTGQSLTLFPEGTSTDGVHVEPFKSSLFEAARLEEGGGGMTELRVAIQPVTVAYTHQAGRRMNQKIRDNYAWYANMPFTTHFFNLFALKKVDVKVHFHPVTYLDEFTSRKECAEHCFDLVERQLLKFINEGT